MSARAARTPAAFARAIESTARSPRSDIPEPSTPPAGGGGLACEASPPRPARSARGSTGAARWPIVVAIDSRPPVQASTTDSAGAPPRAAGHGPPAAARRRAASADRSRPAPRQRPQAVVEARRRRRPVRTVRAAPAQWATYDWRKSPPRRAAASAPGSRRAAPARWRRRTPTPSRHVGAPSHLEAVGAIEGHAEHAVAPEDLDLVGVGGALSGGDRDECAGAHRGRHDDALIDHLTVGGLDGDALELLAEQMTAEVDVMHRDLEQGSAAATAFVPPAGPRARRGGTRRPDGAHHLGGAERARRRIPRAWATRRCERRLKPMVSVPARAPPPPRSPAHRHDPEPRASRVDVLARLEAGDRERRVQRGGTQIARCRRPDPRSAHRRPAGPQGGIERQHGVDAGGIGVGRGDGPQAADLGDRREVERLGRPARTRRSRFPCPRSWN